MTFTLLNLVAIPSQTGFKLNLGRDFWLMDKRLGSNGSISQVYTVSSDCSPYQN